MSSGTCRIDHVPGPSPRRRDDALAAPGRAPRRRARARRPGPQPSSPPAPPPVTLAQTTSLRALARPPRPPPRSIPASSRRRRRVRIDPSRPLTPPRTPRSRSPPLRGADLGPSCGPPRASESPRPGRRPVTFAVQRPRRLVAGADLAALDGAALGRSPRSPPALEQVRTHVPKHDGGPGGAGGDAASRPRSRALRGCFFPPGACGTDLGQHVRPQQMVHD